jgi:hypothetical protein
MSAAEDRIADLEQQVENERSKRLAAEHRAALLREVVEQLEAEVARLKAETGPGLVTCCEDDRDAWRGRRRWSCPSHAAAGPAAVGTVCRRDLISMTDH